MKKIFEQIKTCIRNHQSIKNHTLNEVSIWKRSHFIVLAKIISDHLSNSPFLKGERRFELGTTISYITLQRFYENKFSESATNDLRFLKTLDKLCIFLGYYDLNEYIVTSNSIKAINNSEKLIKPYKEIIENFCKHEFSAYQKLPEIDIDKLYNYSFHNSNVLERVKISMKKYQESKYFFDFDYKFNKFELLDCQLISNEEDFKVLKAHEHWDFILKSDIGSTFIYKVINYQSYYLKKDEDGIWKIWDNYNPHLLYLISDNNKS